MIKKSRIRFFLIAVICCLAGGDALLAQTPEERVSFARGQSSATISKPIPGNGKVLTYVLYVKKGQKIEARVTSASGKVDLDAANISAGQFEESGNKSFNVPIDRTGDYQIYVRNTGRSAGRFTLKITVR